MIPIDQIKNGKIEGHFPWEMFFEGDFEGLEMYANYKCHYFNDKLIPTQIAVSCEIEGGQPPVRDRSKLSNDFLTKAKVTDIKRNASGELKELEFVSLEVFAHMEDKEIEDNLGDEVKFILDSLWEDYLRSDEYEPYNI